MSAFDPKRTSRYASRSLTGFPQCFSGRIRRNNTPKLFNKHRHYLRAHGPMSALPPKTDIGVAANGPYLHLENATA
jgi:hypothetical protein